MNRYETLLVEDQGRVRIITFNRPETLNSLDKASGLELVEALEEAGRNQSVRALVLTGKGRAFSAGGDIKLMARVLEQGQKPGGLFMEITALLNRSIITLRRIPKPVIAAVNGVTAGGALGWCLACDLVLASSKAVFDPGYIRIALSPDGGCTAFLPRLIGLKRASRFFMCAEPISSEKALLWGMINQVTEPDRLLPEALALAGELAEGPARALAATKELLNRAVLGDLETILEQERLSLVKLLDEPDHAQGLRAFIEKKKPDFA